MPPTPEYVIPVIAHRVFGSRFTGAYLDRRRPSDDFDPFSAAEPPPVVLRGSLAGGERVFDRSHGTTRDWPEIRAMFTSDSDAPGSDGTTVNDLWAETGMRFELVDELDDKISSGMADFLPGNVRIWKPVILPLLLPGGINLFFLRQMDGQYGSANYYQPTRPDKLTYSLVSDRIAVPDEPGPDGRWQTALRTLSHEFGHNLGLGHVGWRNNAMFGGGVRTTSIGLEMPQIATCRYRAAFLSGTASAPPAHRPPRI